MSTQNVVERILSDAKAEAEKIVKDAERKAAQLVEDAALRAEKEMRQVEDEVRERAQYILEKRAAAARLDGAKVVLAQKRRVIDEVYAQAESRLINARKEDCLAMMNGLLEKYAQDGDEICLAENFKYEEELKLLPVLKARNLTIAEQRLAISGGCRLRGRVCDKDLSFGALLAADREKNQAVLAAELFS